MIDNYKRILATRKAEQILAKSRIHVDISKLAMMNTKRPSDEKTKYYLEAKDTGFIQTSYSAVNKITARMFTTSGSLNLITLSDSDIMKCINSRHVDGHIVEIDYSSFEFGIACDIMGFSDFNGIDVHQFIADELGITRDKAKGVIYAAFYGMRKDNLLEIITVKQLEKFFELFRLFFECKSDFIAPLEQQFDNDNSITNIYGRLIYPKSKRNIFNNVVQTTGSDILIDTVIKIDKHNIFNILFHRFDALFFDFSKCELHDNLDTLVEIMKSSKEVNLHTSIAIGDTLHNLKKLK